MQKRFQGKKFNNISDFYFSVYGIKIAIIKQRVKGGDKGKRDLRLIVKDDFKAGIVSPIK